MFDNLYVLNLRGFTFLVRPTRWLFRDGVTNPIEGIDANGVLHTMNLNNCKLFSSSADRQSDALAAS